MTVTTLTDIVFGLAVIGWLCVRQLRWTALRPSRLWRLPVVLGAVGAISLLGSGGRTLSATDLALLLVEAAVAFGTGAAMGRITVFRPLTGRVPALHDGEPVPSLECRTGWFGVALWAVLIVVRIGIALIGAHLGAVALESTGVILLTVAANRIARAAVVQARISGVPAAIARR
jgi:hypothetical protein